MPNVSTLVAAASALSAASFAWSANAAPPAPMPPPAVAQAAVPPESPARDPVELRYPSKSVGVFINPLGMLFGTLGAEVDFKVADFATINVGGSYYHRSTTLLDTTTTTNAYGGDLGAQFFPFGRAFNQMYIYPRFSYMRATATATHPGSVDTSSNSSLLGMGATIGYQWVWNPGFSLRLGAGMSYFTSIAKDDSETVEVSLSGVLPAIDASIGWTF